MKSKFMNEKLVDLNSLKRKKCHIVLELLSFLQIVNLTSSTIYG